MTLVVRQFIKKGHLPVYINLFGGKHRATSRAIRRLRVTTGSLKRDFKLWHFRHHVTNGCLNVSFLIRETKCLNQPAKEKAQHDCQGGNVDEPKLNRGTICHGCPTIHFAFAVWIHEKEEGKMWWGFFGRECFVLLLVPGCDWGFALIILFWNL